MTAMPPPPKQRRSRVVGTLGLIGILACLGVGGVAMTFPGLRASMAEMIESAPAPRPSPVSGDRAFGYLKTICEIGPRPAGSPANKRQRDMVAEHFRKHGGTVREQPFAGRDPLSGADVQMANLIGSWFPERSERVLLGVHYDTRPFPDEDKDPARRRPATRLKAEQRATDPRVANLRVESEADNATFLGANDGASGVALLMEIAHHLADSGTPWGVDLVLFDGEELVYGGGQNQTGDYFLGSKFFAKAYADEHQGRGRNAPKPTFEYEAALVLDMVGDKNLNIGREPYSLEFAGKLVNDVWGVAKALKVPEFRSEQGRGVYDDHLPLNDVGIPAIDIIDFDYPHWHTAQDVPANCSGRSLEQVGKVVTAWLNKPKIARR